MVNLIVVAFVVQFASTFLPSVYRRIYYVLVVAVIFVPLGVFLINRQLGSILEMLVVISAMLWANIAAWFVTQLRAGAASFSYRQPNSALYIAIGAGLLLIGVFQFGLALGQNISENLSLLEQSFLTFYWGIGSFSIGAHTVALGLFHYSLRAKGVTLFGSGLIEWALVGSYAWRDDTQNTLQLHLKKRFIFSHTIGISIPVGDKKAVDHLLHEKVHSESNELKPSLNVG